MEAETVAFVYLVTGEEKYGKAARERIVALAKWNPDGQTNLKSTARPESRSCIGSPALTIWTYDALTPEDRELVRAAVLRRVSDAWVSGEVQRGVGHINRPLNSHGNRTWHKIARAGSFSWMKYRRRTPG